jgi:hypothetical protein
MESWGVTIMALVCNIDQTGRVVRAISGVLLLLLGIIVIAMRWPVPPWWIWSLGIVLIIGGGFQIFEAAVGWCALRAMGIRTRV